MRNEYIFTNMRYYLTAIKIVLQSEFEEPKPYVVRYLKVLDSG